MCPGGTGEAGSSLQYSLSASLTSTTIKSVVVSINSFASFGVTSVCPHTEGFGQKKDRKSKNDTIHKVFFMMVLWGKDYFSKYLTYISQK
jgi:hypothetical protein